MVEEPFPLLRALVSLAVKYDESHAVFVMILEELLFLSCYRAHSTSLSSNLLLLQNEVLKLIERITTIKKECASKIGRYFLDIVMIHYNEMEAPTIANLMQLSCFSKWQITFQDVKKIGLLASHHTLNLVSLPGTERVDEMVEELFLSKPTAQFSPQNRAFATRVG